MQYKKQSFKIENIVLFVFSFSLFCNSYFFVMWPTYEIPALTLLCELMSYLGGFLIIFLFLAKNSLYLRIHRKLFFVILVAVVFEVHINLFGQSYKNYLNIGQIWLVIQLFILLQLDQEYLVKIFKYISIIFLAMALPGLIYFILTNIGVSLPYSLLNSARGNKYSVGAYYRHYPFGIILYQSGYLARYCGVFDEPGVVGTISALLIAAGYKRLDKRIVVLLFIEGFFTFSMAFYVLIVVYAISRAFMNGAKKVALVGIVLFVTFNTFMNANISNEYLAKVQSRIDLSSLYLVEDNRTTTAFDAEYEKFLDDGGYPLIMGYGQGAVENNKRMTASSSYKKLVYNYGIVGFSLMLLFFVLVWWEKGINKESLPFVLVFFSSIIQRPYVFTIQYITIFVAAVVFINSAKENFRGIEKNEK